MPASNSQRKSLIELQHQTDPGSTVYDSHASYALGENGYLSLDTVVITRPHSDL
jgi:hypothetical protein